MIYDYELIRKFVLASLSRVDQLTILFLKGMGLILANICSFLFQGPTDHFVSPSSTNAGSFVLGLSAIDADEGRNAELTFLLSGRDAEMFSLDPINGVLTASERSDFFRVILNAFDTRIFFASLRNRMCFLWA